jgi:hypothetical protein
MLLINANDEQLSAELDACGCGDGVTGWISMHFRYHAVQLILHVHAFVASVPG